MVANFSQWRVRGLAIVVLVVLVCLTAVPASGASSTINTTENASAFNGTFQEGKSDGEVGSPTSAATDADMINVTYTVNRTPADKQRVRVNFTARLPDSVKEFEVYFNESLDDSFSVTSSDGIHYNQHEEAWVITESGTTAHLTYTIASNLTGTFGQSTVETKSWAFLGSEQLGAYYNWLTTNWPMPLEEHYEVAGEGYASDGYAFAGPVTVHERSTDGNTLRLVVPDAAQSDTTPKNVLRALENASTTLEIAGYESDVTGFVGPSPLRRGGRASDNAFWAHESSLLLSGSTWFHEYVHTRQRWISGYRSDFSLDDDLEWLTEASADYYSGYLPWQTNRTDVANFREYIATDQYANKVLQAPNTTSSELKNYYKGRRVLAALDIRIRNHTDGTHTLMDVLREVNTYSGSDYGYAAFRNEVVNKTSPATGDWLDTYVQTEAVPSIPSVGDIRTAYSVEPDNTLNVTLSRHAVPEDELADVTVTVTDPDTGQPVGNATVTLHGYGSSTSGVTNASGIVELELFTTYRDEYVIETSAKGYATTRATLPLYEPIRDPVTLSAVDLEPGAVTANTTSNLTITTTVTNISNDTSTDQLTISLADTVTLDHLNDITVSDARNDAVTVDDWAVNQNTITVDISPGSRLQTDTLTVELESTVTAPNITESIGANFTVSVSDSSNGEETMNATLTVLPADAQPAVVGSDSVQDLDGDGTTEDINGDGTFNIVDVSAMFQNYNSDAVQGNTALFDFNDDGQVNIVDVSRLFQNSQK